MRIQYVLTSLVRPFIWSDSISILFCFAIARHIIILFGAHLPCTLKWKAISRKNDTDKNPSNENDNEDETLEQPKIERTPSHSTQRVIYISSFSENLPNSIIKII